MLTTPKAETATETPYNGVEEDVLAVEVAFYLRLPFGVRVERELRVVLENGFDPACQGFSVGARPGFYGEELALVLVEVAGEDLLGEVDAHPAAHDIVLEDTFDPVFLLPLGPSSPIPDPTPSLGGLP